MHVLVLLLTDGSPFAGPFNQYSGLVVPSHLELHSPNTKGIQDFSFVLKVGEWGQGVVQIA